MVASKSRSGEFDVPRGVLGLHCRLLRVFCNQRHGFRLHHVYAAQSQVRFYSVHLDQSIVSISHRRV